MEFDEKANRIIFRCYSPWVEKKMKILSGQLDNKGILLPEEMRMFPFDKLFNTREETDNTVVDMNFRERFGGLGKEKAEPSNPFTFPVKLLYNGKNSWRYLRMARRKNYAKQLDILQKKLGELDAKYAAAKETMESLEEERMQIEEEIDGLKLQQLQQLMADRKLSVDDLTKLIEGQENQ